MELSIIQHAKDKAPRQMAVNEVVGLMKGNSWPTGYQPLAVIGAVVDVECRFCRSWIGSAVNDAEYGFYTLRHVKGQFGC